MGSIGRFRRHLDESKAQRRSYRVELLRKYEKDPKPETWHGVPLWLLQRLWRAAEMKTRNIFRRNLRA